MPSASNPIANLPGADIGSYRCYPTNDLMAGNNGTISLSASNDIEQIAV